MEILLFNSILNIRKNKNIAPQIKFHNYHFWVLEKLRNFRFLVRTEYILRGLRWKLFFNKFDIIFFIDPNQYYLLPYLSNKHKLVYLLRDPSVLMDKRNYVKELPIIRKANAILAVSDNLCSYYFLKYYKYIPNNVHLWSNTVDLELWDYDHWKIYRKESQRPVIGLAGNINYVIDIELLIYIASELTEYDFEFAGKLELNESEKSQMKKLLSLPNVRHLGFIPFNKFPQIVINWSIGIVAAKPDHEFAKYLNNNKQYQYLAMGKPFVSYSLNADYKEFEDMVFIAKDKKDYIVKIRHAINKSNDIKSFESGIRISRKHSASVRAEEFIRILKKL
jgi:hypothetical protein